MVGKRILTLLGALVIPATLLLAPIALVSGTADAATAAGASLPPSARKDLVAIFGPQVRKYGLRVTRAALVDRDAGAQPDAARTSRSTSSRSATTRRRTTSTARSR